MNLIAKVGLPGLAAILIILIYLLTLSLRVTEANYAPILIIASKLLNQIVGGFPFSNSLGSIFGDANTVLTYTLLSLAFIDAFFFRTRYRWPRSNLFIFLGLYILGLGFILWMVFLGATIGLSFYIFLLTLTLFIYSHPTKRDFGSAPYLCFLIICIIFICAVVRFQNPYFPYSQSDFGLDGPYHNLVWDFFGHTERFRGPYISPNILGFNVVFILVFAKIRKSKLNIVTQILGFLILLLSGSRISLIAYSSFQIYSLVLATKKQDGLVPQPVASKLTSGKKKIKPSLYIGFFIVLGSIWMLISSDPTLNGRTNNYAVVMQSLQGHYLFGAGFSNYTSVENTIITILGNYGAFGLAALILIITGLFSHFRSLAATERKILIPVSVAFLIASLGESLLNGGPYDIGLLYIFIFLFFKPLVEEEESNETARSYE